MTVIEELKDNVIAFELMPIELKDEARDIGLEFFEEFIGNSLWEQCGVGAFDPRMTYRLEKDYEEMPEIRKHKIYDSHGLWFNASNKQISVTMAPNHPDFIGFLYEEDRVSLSPRLYVSKDCVSSVYVATSYTAASLGQLNSGDRRTLIPTHALFQRKKEDE